MDLMQVEGLADLMSSYTLSQKKQALQQLSGTQSNQFENWRRDIVSILAHMEANIDFGEDEDDVAEDAINSSCIDRVKRLIDEIQQQLLDSKHGELIREGINIAIVGQCNVGKSSLINHLVQQDVSIVTSLPGTTRDIVERNMFLNGVAVKLADTAGFRDTEDAIEVAGIRLSSSRLHQCQLAIVVLDATSPKITHPVLTSFLSDVRLQHCKTPVVMALNKIDLIEQADIDRIISKIRDRFGKFDIFPISIKAGHNTSSIVQAVSSHIENITNTVDYQKPALVTRQRHLHLLKKALRALGRFVAKDDLGLDARTEDLRLAVGYLAQLTSSGRVYNDEIIDTIFRDFCIGK